MLLKLKSEIFWSVLYLIIRYLSRFSDRNKKNNNRRYRWWKIPFLRSLRNRNLFSRREKWYSWIKTGCRLDRRKNGRGREGGETEREKERWRRSNKSDRREKVLLIFRRTAIISPPHTGTGTGGSLRHASLLFSLSFFVFVIFRENVWKELRINHRGNLLAIRREERELDHHWGEPSRVKECVSIHFASGLQSLKVSNSNCIEEGKRYYSFDNF